MLQDGRIARLSEAKGTGEILTIVYEGGTQPGTKRDIIVIGLQDGGSPRPKVRAMCLETGLPKWFFVDLLKIVDPDYPVPAYRARTRSPARATGTEKRSMSKSPELRELQKQTRMMAEKDAYKTAVSGAFIAVVAVWMLWKWKPEWAALIPVWLYCVFVGLMALLAGVSRYHELTRDE